MNLLRLQNDRVGLDHNKIFSTWLADWNVFSVIIFGSGRIIYRIRNGHMSPSCTMIWMALISIAHHPRLLLKYLIVSVNLDLIKAIAPPRVPMYWCISIMPMYSWRCGHWHWLACTCFTAQCFMLHCSWKALHDKIVKYWSCPRWKKYLVICFTP